MFTHVCNQCKKEFESKRRVKKFCCDGCYQLYRKNPDVIEKSVEKRKNTCLEKYGVDNASKSNDVKDRAKKTCLKRYGEVSPSKNKKIKEKQKETCLQKYGVGNPMQNTHIKNKMFDTCEYKYGNKHVNKIDNIRKKAESTLIENYGVTNPMKSDDIKDKIKNTCLEKYGVDHPMKLDDIKYKKTKKFKKTIYDRIIKGNRLPENIIPLFTYDEYISNNRDNEYKFKCNICNSSFKDHLSNGREPRCFVCNPRDDTFTSSVCEDEIYEYIKTIYSGKIIRNTYSVINPMELDLYLPELNIAIEFNGLYWHSEVSGKKYKNYHVNKTKKCEESNIQLIHIFEDEWKYKTDIIKSKLKSIMNVSDACVFARKCEVVELSSKEKNEFLNRTHIQGEDKSKVKLGLMYENKLVATMTFSHKRIALGQKNKNVNEYELSRYSSSIRVVGGASKLLKHFIRNWNPDSIISYSDKRFSVGKLYESIGFVKIKDTPPNYWYMDSKYLTRIYRFNYAKHNLSVKLDNFNCELSEWENMKVNGFDRIWDCGSIKYEMVVNEKTS